MDSMIAGVLIGCALSTCFMALSYFFFFSLFIRASNNQSKEIPSVFPNLNIFKGSPKKRSPKSVSDEELWKMEQAKLTPLDPLRRHVDED